MQKVILRLVNEKNKPFLRFRIFTRWVFRSLQGCVTSLTGPVVFSLCLLLPSIQHISWFLWFAQLMQRILSLLNSLYPSDWSLIDFIHKWLFWIPLSSDQFNWCIIERRRKKRCFVSKLVLTYYEEKLFLWLKISFKAEDREFAKFLRPPEQFIWTLKGQKNFENRMLF